MKQTFNVTEAATIAKDLQQDAKNYSLRLNDSAHLEEEFIRFYVAKFSALNVNLHHAIQLDTPNLGIRSKRNIFGDILSSLTGLVTHEGTWRIFYK